MNLYQYVVLGTLVVVLGSGAYFIVKTDSQGVILQTIGESKPVMSQDQISATSGIYTCGNDSGCGSQRILNLKDDGGAELDTTYGDGSETLTEAGDWYIGQRGFMTIHLSGSQVGAYTKPKTITVRGVGTSTLSRLVFSSKDYSDMVNAIFLKQGI